MTPMSGTLTEQWDALVQSTISFAPGPCMTLMILAMAVALMGAFVALFQKFSRPDFPVGTGAKTAIILGSVLGSPISLVPVTLSGVEALENFLRTITSDKPQPEPQPQPVEPREPIDVDWSTVGLVTLAIIGVLVLVGGVIFGAHHLRERRRAKRVADGIVDERLDAMRASVDAIASRLGEVQTDVVESIELYALFDIQFDESSRFWEKWITVNDRLAEAEKTRTVPSSLRAEVDAAARAWQGAYANAERLGVSAVGKDREKDATKAVRALRLAKDGGDSPEADNAWETAARLLATLNLAHLPKTAVAAVDDRARTAITAAH